MQKLPWLFCLVAGLTAVATTASAFNNFPGFRPPPDFFPPNPGNNGSGLPDANTPIQLDSIQSVIDSLRKGHSVSVESDLSQCTPNSNSPVSTVQDGRTITSYTVGDDGVFRFSGTRLYAPKDENGTPMEILYQYQANPSKSTDTIRYYSQSFDLPSFHVGGDRVSYDCQIGQGVIFYQTN